MSQIALHCHVAATAHHQFASTNFHLKSARDDAWRLPLHNVLNLELFPLSMNKERALSMRRRRDISHDSKRR